MDHPYDKKIQVCSNKLSGATNSHTLNHTLRGQILYRFIYSKGLSNLLLTNHWPECFDLLYCVLLWPGDSSLFI